jgi:predicted Zn finger-like uncharacterized protein
MESSADHGTSKTEAISNLMDIKCDKCQSKFKISDEKIPKGKSASVTCTKCQNKIVIKSQEDLDDAYFEEPDGSNGEQGFDFDDDFMDGDEEAERAFDFIEDEGKTAMICEADPEVKKQIMPILDFMEFHITEISDSRDAIKKLRYNSYHMIIVNENFDTTDPDNNGVLIYLARLPMMIRRNIFVAMLSDRYRTMDHMMSLNKSVNMIINLKNLNEIERILKHGISDTDFFYRIYQESLKTVGLA